MQKSTIYRKPMGENLFEEENGKDLWNPEEHGKQWIWLLRCYAGHLLGIRKW